MSKINQKECINVNFSNRPGIFNEHFGYTEIDGLTYGVVDIQGLQTHAVRIFSLPERKELIFNIDDCPYPHIDFTELRYKEES